MQGSFDEYLDTVCGQIRCKKAHDGDIRTELKNHMEDQCRAFMVDGMGEEAAITQTIRQMGDPVIVGGELDATHRPRPEWSTLVMTGIMLLIGLALQFLVLRGTEFQGEFYFTLIAVPVGLALFMGIYLLDYTALLRHAFLLYGGLAYLA